VRAVASAPTAYWISNLADSHWVQPSVAAYIGAATAAHAEPMLVLYAIPHRDCGNYSAGGFASGSDYQAWVRQVNAGIAGRRVAVIVEPDALAQLDCLAPSDQATRLALLRYAVSLLSANRNATVYLDGGHSRWLSAPLLAQRLKAAGVDMARGFSLNVSNFFTTAEEVVYGEAVSTLLGGNKYYVVDTSRNGRGPLLGVPNEWCNPTGRALGTWPSAATGATHADAYLWVKPPGQSDGNCHPGDPTSGQWFESYAVQLAANAGF
jgi:endoglucanase